MKTNVIIGIGFLILAAILVFLSAKKVLGNGFLDKGDKIASIVALFVAIVSFINPFTHDDVNKSSKASESKVINSLGIQQTGGDQSPSVIGNGVTINYSGSSSSPPKDAVPQKPLDFEAFNLSWHVWKGNPSISPSEILLAGLADVQTNDNYSSPRSLIVTAKAEKWAPDTSVGFEIWDDPGRYSIRVSRGKLIIETPMETPRVDGYKYEKEIPDWSTLRKDSFTLKIAWDNKQVKLYINDRQILDHKSPKIPIRSLNVRLNAANGDSLTVTKVEVK